MALWIERPSRLLSRCYSSLLLLVRCSSFAAPRCSPLAARPSPGATAAAAAPRLLPLRLLLPPALPAAAKRRGPCWGSARLRRPAPLAIIITIVIITVILIFEGCPLSSSAPWPSRKPAPPACDSGARVQRRSHVLRTWPPCLFPAPAPRPHVTRPRRDPPAGRARHDDEARDGIVMPGRAARPPSAAPGGRGAAGPRALDRSGKNGVTSVVRGAVYFILLACPSPPSGQLASPQAAPACGGRAPGLPARSERLGRGPGSCRLGPVPRSPVPPALASAKRSPG